MYKVVLVDDEKYSIIDLLHTLPWEKYGFQVVAYYTDPLEALAAIGALEPDFLFTDIRMPGLDGLQLIAKVQQMNLKTQFVITSSFADFQYAQQAIRSGVLDYCLKPLDEENAAKLLGRLADHMDTTNEAKVKDDSLLEQILDYLQANLQKPLSLTDLSREFHISSTTCCALFASIDTTFSKYLMKQRLEYARRLLESSQFSINEIAEMCGFRDYSYFNKSFRRAYEIPPARYRNEVKKKP